MNFKAIDISDKEIMDPYLQQNKFGVCDFSFANLFIWRGLYAGTYAIHKGYMVIKAHAPQSKAPHFLMPFCKNGGECDLTEIITDMIAYCKEIGVQFRMFGLTVEMLELLRPIMPENFMVQENDLYDYIYMSEDLITLKGKKFHSKRNHINKFNSLYNYEYVDITPENMHLCRTVMDKWLAENADEMDAGMVAEKIAVNEAMTHFGELKLKGGALLVDGAPIAFSMGQPINAKFFDVQIEKASYEIEGAYAKINQEFAAHNCADYDYINREEDMGVPGLRKAKLSYNPVLLLYKHIAYLAF